MASAIMTPDAQTAEAIMLLKIKIDKFYSKKMLVIRIKKSLDTQKAKQRFYQDLILRKHMLSP